MSFSNTYIRFFDKDLSLSEELERMKIIHGSRLRLVGLDYPLLEHLSVYDNLLLFGQGMDEFKENLELFVRDILGEKLSMKLVSELSAEESFLVSMCRACLLKDALVLILYPFLLCSQASFIENKIKIMLENCDRIFIFDECKHKHLYSGIL